MSVQEFRYQIYPRFPRISIDVLKALKIEKRGLAVSLYLRDLRLRRPEFDPTNQDPELTEWNGSNVVKDKGSLVAGRYIDNLVKEHGEEIKNINIFNCCECRQMFIAYEECGILFSLDGNDQKHFACKDCIKKEELKRAENTDVIPFDQWPNWAKEAFGPKRTGVEFNW